jgi:hypothetical protein
MSFSNIMTTLKSVAFSLREVNRNIFLTFELPFLSKEVSTCLVFAWKWVRMSA